MQVKGISVKSVAEYVQKQFPGRYNEWLNQLPENSKKIFSDFIRVNEWYPLRDALTVPLRVVGKVFFSNDWKKAVWTMGRYSADEALTGIYKLYVKIGSVKHIIDRSSRIMSAYFQPSEMKVAKTENKQVVLQITKFDEPDEAIENNIAAWIERALEISGCKNVNVNISKSLCRKDPLTELIISWI